MNLFAVVKILQSLHKELGYIPEKIPGFDQLDHPSRRSLKYTLRYLLPLEFFWDQRMKKEFKKSSLSQAKYAAIICLQEIILHQQPLYHIGSVLKSFLIKIKQDWLLQKIIYHLKHPLSLDVLLIKYWESQLLLEQSVAPLIDKEIDPKHFFSHPPMWVRLKKEDQHASELLSYSQHVEYDQFSFYRLTKHDRVSKELFSSGVLSFQDLAAGLYCELLSLLKPIVVPKKIIETCAAPGGKSCLIVNFWPEADIILNDISEQRLESLRLNLERQRINHKTLSIQIHDWSLPSRHQADILFVDAPCSGTGVIRRHPDILWNRTKESIELYKETQIKILLSAINSTKSQGFVVYSTCSILPQENDFVIEEVLSQGTVKLVAISLSLGKKTNFGWQVHPTEEHDGLYYCLLQKK